MQEFKPQQVPDPIISPGKSFPSLQPQGDPGAGGPSGFKEFFLNNKWYFLAILVGVVIIGALAFFAFRPQKAEPQKEANVDIEITSADTAPSGGEVIYKVKIQNNDPAKLVDMDLEMVYAEGVSYISSTPPSENISGSRFNVPDLTTGQNVVLIVKTLAQGNVNDEKKLVAKLRYKFENFNSEFVRETTHTVRLVAADIILDMSGPDTATNSEVVTYNIFYRNNSNKDVDSARIKVTYPEGFSYADGNPKPSLSQNIWNIGTLKPQGTGKLSFQGSFSSARPGASGEFKVEFEVVDDNGNFFTQGSTTFSTNISSVPLLVEHKLAGANTSGIVKPGDTVSYEVSFQNNSPVVATGVIIIAELDSKALNYGSIKSDSGSVNDNTITWNGAGVPTLQSLNPNEKGTLKFSVQVNNPATKEGLEKLTIISKIKIKSNEISTYQPGNELTLKVSSPSSMSGSVSYVSGALPPKVGQLSTFRVKVELTNATNDLGNSTMVGFIPAGVTFIPGSVSTKELALVKYDSSTGKITWSAGILDANSGTFNPVRILNFDVSITPSLTQKGRSVELFKNITFTAKDTFTDQAINMDMQNLTTDDMEGQSNRGKVTE